LKRKKSVAFYGGDAPAIEAPPPKSQASSFGSLGSFVNRSGGGGGGGGIMDVSRHKKDLRSQKTFVADGSGSINDRSERRAARQRRRFWSKVRLHLRPSFWLYWLDKNLPIIDPRLLPRTIWDFWMLALVIYVCFTVPYSVGFGYHSLYLSPYIGFNSESPPPGQPFPPPAPPHAIPTHLTAAGEAFDAVTWVVDVFFWLDLLSNFRTAYIDSSANLVRNGGQIARNYLKLWFWLDLLASVPFDKIVLLFVELSGSELAALQLVRVLRLLRLARLMRVLERLRSAGTFLRLAKLLFFVLVVVHWTTCLWFFIFQMTYNTIQQPWSFTEQVEFGSSTFTYFLAAFYNTFVLMIGNNIDPGNSWEQALCCFVTLGGAAFYSIILGSISLLVSNMDPGATRHRLKRDIIHNTMRYLGVNKELVNKVSAYFDYLLQRSHPGPDGLNTLQQLPKSMFRDISVWMYYEGVKKVPLFQDCEDAFIRQLVMRLRLQVYLTGETVFRIGDVGHEMYFITKGFVAVTNEIDEMLTMLPKGAFFGELGLLAAAHRTASCTAMCESDLSMLTASDLMSAMSAFPDSARVVRERSFKRLIELQSAHNEQQRRAALIQVVEEEIEAQEMEELIKSRGAAGLMLGVNLSRSAPTLAPGPLPPPPLGVGTRHGSLPRMGDYGAARGASTSGILRNPSLEGGRAAAGGGMARRSSMLGRGGGISEVLNYSGEDTDTVLDALIRTCGGATARVSAMEDSMKQMADHLEGLAGSDKMEHGHTMELDL